MRRWLRLLPLLITALWLPLQAVAAVAMPFCRHAAEQAVQFDAAVAEEHCHGHGGSDAPPPGSAAADQDCDGCELCHLAGAGYMLPAMAMAESLPPARDFERVPFSLRPAIFPNLRNIRPGN